MALSLAAAATHSALMSRTFSELFLHSTRKNGFACFFTPFSSFSTSVALPTKSSRKSWRQPVVSMLEIGGVKIAKDDVVRDDPTNNMPGTNFSKLGLLFTTRSLDVCQQMNCQEEDIIKVESLSGEEAWTLFEREHGFCDIKVESYARAILEKCDGLPLAIKTTGKSMRRLKDNHGWRVAANKITDSTHGKRDMDKVFSSLRYSYNCLNYDLSLQQCFLYCALFPEDHMIEKKELIELLILEGIVKRKSCRCQEADEGHDKLTELVNLCLLEADNDYGGVEMHDLIRDMALKILREESLVMVDAGMQLMECPDADKWDRSLFRVSLMKNNFRKIGSEDWQPICPNLSTLLLSENYQLERI